MALFRCGMNTNKRYLYFITTNTSGRWWMNFDILYYSKTIDKLTHFAPNAPMNIR